MRIRRVGLVGKPYGVPWYFTYDMYLTGRYLFLGREAGSIFDLDSKQGALLFALPCNLTVLTLQDHTRS